MSIVYAQTRNELLERIAPYTTLQPTQQQQQHQINMTIPNNEQMTQIAQQVIEMKKHLRLAVDYVEFSRAILDNSEQPILELWHVISAFDRANAGILKLAQIVDKLLDIVWQAPTNTNTNTNNDTTTPPTWQQHEAAQATPPHAATPPVPQAPTPPWPVHFAITPQVNPTAKPQPPVLAPKLLTPQTQLQVLKILLELTLEKQMNHANLEQLMDMVAARAYTLNNVANVEVLNKSIP
jgi:hypothetical protein